LIDFQIQFNPNATFMAPHQLWINLDPAASLTNNLELDEEALDETHWFQLNPDGKIREFVMDPSMRRVLSKRSLAEIISPGDKKRTRIHDTTAIPWRMVRLFVGVL
jgi:hypothetical protein